MIDFNFKDLTIDSQCKLLNLARSTLYYHPCSDDERKLKIMRVIDEIYTKNPEYGNRRMHFKVNILGYNVGRDLIRSLMHKMGIEAIYPKRNLSKSTPGHKIYPYLLRGIKIEKPNQVWSTDITYIRIRNGFFYLTAVIDWYSRYVLAWKLSNSLSGLFCREVLLEALEHGKPEIFNTDQGSQYTSEEFLGILISRNILPSMDGRGRALDNIFVERLWRSVKYENIYLKEYNNGFELYSGMKEYFLHYNEERPHMALNYLSPGKVYRNES